METDIDSNPPPWLRAFRANLDALSHVAVPTPALRRRRDALYKRGAELAERIRYVGDKTNVLMAPKRQITRLADRITRWMAETREFALLLEEDRRERQQPALSTLDALLHDFRDDPDQTLQVLGRHMVDNVPPAVRLAISLGMIMFGALRE